MTAAERELERKLLREYARARATLLDGFSFPSGKGYSEDYIQQTLLTCSAKQAEIILADLPESFLSGVYIESDILRDKVPAYTGVDLSRISKTHLNRITKEAIGDIGNFNTVVETDLIKRHRQLLSDNELVNQITKHGWTKETEKRILDAGFDKKVLHLAKQQTTTPKMIEILEMHGIRGGMHPKEVSVLLRPHIRDVFGDEGVLIDNTGKLRNRFIVDADGKYKWVTQEVKEKYRATVKTYSETISRSSMVQTHINGRTETLKQSGLVEKYRSIANMTANTCSQCAMMHGQIIDPNEGPLYHPNCSCRRAPVWKKKTGLMNHTDEFYENQRNEHFWKQHQLKGYNKTLPKGDKIPNYNFLPKDQLTGMPGKEGMRKIRAEMLGQPQPPTTPQITAMDEYTINTPLRDTRGKLAPFDVDKNPLDGTNNKINFTFAEHGALDEYKGGRYRVINKHLRGKPTPVDISPETIKNIDSALKKSKLPCDVVTYRGISPRLAETIKKTNVCTDKGFSSTGFDPDMALRFAPRGKDRFKNVMIFKTPKGTNALMWPEYESEILLERGLKLKCVKIQEVDKVSMRYGPATTQRLVEPKERVRFFIMEEVPKKPTVIKPKKVTLDSAKINSNPSQIQENLASFDVDDNLHKTRHTIKFSESEGTALNFYKKGDYLDIEGYSHINTYLRTGITKTPLAKQKITDCIKEMDIAIKKSKLPSDVTVYRGISPRTAKLLMKENTCTGMGYSSATYKPKTALSFVSEGEDGYTNMMVFKYKKGADALMWDVESEVLSARGLKLKCIEIKEIGELEITYGETLAGKLDNIRIFIMGVQ